MATKEQHEASGAVMQAVADLNEALSEAGRVGLFVELRHNAGAGGRNGAYYVDKIETREMVLPR